MIKDNTAKLMGLTVAMQMRIDALKGQLSRETVNLMVPVRLQEVQHVLDQMVEHANYIKYTEEHEAAACAFDEYVIEMEADGTNNQYKNEAL